MPRFVLLDHSLVDAVGHHYGYARLLLQAARDSGLRPILVANKALGPLGPDFPEVEVHRLFRHSTYCRHTYDARHAQHGRGSAGVRFFAPAARGWTRVARLWRIRRFGAGCAALLETVPLEAGDVVFAATMSELDFAGLARWLAQEPRTRPVSWHVQFHVNLFRGREPDYSGQEDVACAVRDVLAQALAGLGGHHLRLYCTTEPLARQYARLGVAHFETLPYPVDEALQPRKAPQPEGAPLQIACLGHSRRERGYRHLSALVRELWDDYLTPGRVRLVIQARRGKVRLGALPGAVPGGEPIVFVPVGLSSQRYLDLVRNADIGLLLYDAGRYYTRCSGVLLEMLCAGVPVLVPAGSWLADQIAEEIQLHLDGLCRSAGESLPLQTAAADGARSLPARAAFGAEPVGVDLEVPESARDLLVGFEWGAPQEPGTYVQLESRQHDAAGIELGSTADIVGRRAGQRPVRLLIRLAPRARSLRLLLRNAYGHSTVVIEQLQVRPLAGAGARPAAGAVGLIVADPGCAAAPLRELIDRHEHYRRTAAAFAERCSRQHAAGEVLRRLLAD